MNQFWCSDLTFEKETRCSRIGRGRNVIPDLWSVTEPMIRVKRGFLFLAPASRGFPRKPVPRLYEGRGCCMRRQLGARHSRNHFNFDMND